MNRKEFLSSAVAAVAMSSVFVDSARAAGTSGRLLFGACRPLADAKLLASVGYDFIEWVVDAVLSPEKDADWWTRQKDVILSLPIPCTAASASSQGSSA